MSDDLQRLLRAFDKADLLAQSGDQQAAEDAAAFARQIRQLQNQPTSQGSKQNGVTEFLGQAARSLGEFGDLVTAPGQALGGLISGQDGVEPGHNTPDLLEPAPSQRMVTDALVSARVASPNEPDSVIGAAGAGAGDAMAALLPVAKSLEAARASGGIVGSIADDAYKMLASRLGVALEPAAGALSGGARQMAEDAGASPVVQDLAGLAAPLSIPAMGAAARGVGNVVSRAADFVPGAAYGKEIFRSAQRALVPMTDAGAREVARQRLRDLSGGDARAERLGQDIDPQDTLGRTGAEQTGDANLLGLQRAAEAENPALRERLEERGDATRQNITAALTEQGGDIGDARTFFRKRLADYKRSMNERIERVIAGADGALQSIDPQRPKSDSSARVVEQLKRAFDAEKAEERALWEAIPKDVTMDLRGLKDVAREIVDKTPAANQKHIPQEVTDLLGNQYGEASTFDEIHGLYSELRFVAREARSGDVPNNRRAAMADSMADAILKAFDDIDANSPQGRLIADARAKTRAVNETFRTGAPGRLLNRTRQTVERVPPESALRSTIDRGNEPGAVDARRIASAAPESAEDMQNFLRSRFLEEAIGPLQNFTPRQAAMWMRRNSETLDQFPSLKAELAKAFRSRQSAAEFAVRAEARAGLRSSAEAFNSGQPEQAVRSILGADNPLRTAKSIAATARKDPSGRALEGVKAAFVDYLTQDVEKLPVAIEKGQFKNAMRQVFDPGEARNIEFLAEAMRRMQVRPRDVGQVIDEPANRIVDMVVRVVAAQRGGSLGGGSMGGSLQTANIFTERARAMLSNLQNDKARQLIFDAIEDSQLMRELLTEVRTPQQLRKMQSRLAPYLTGAIAADEQE